MRLWLPSSTVATEGGKTSSSCFSIFSDAVAFEPEDNRHKRTKASRVVHRINGSAQNNFMRCVQRCFGNVAATTSRCGRQVVQMGGECFFAGVICGFELKTIFFHAGDFESTPLSPLFPPLGNNDWLAIQQQYRIPCLHLAPCI